MPNTNPRSRSIGPPLKWLGALGRVSCRPSTDSDRSAVHKTPNGWAPQKADENEHERRPTSSGASGMCVAVSPVFCLSIIYLAAMPSAAIQIIQALLTQRDAPSARRPLCDDLVTDGGHATKSNNDKNRCPLYEKQNGRKTNIGIPK